MTAPTKRNAQTIELRWMPLNAPYAPVASTGLLAILEEAGFTASLAWRRDAQSSMPPTLNLKTSAGLEEIADAISGCDWPGPDVADERLGRGQAIKPILERGERPLWTLRSMVGGDLAGMQESISRRYVRSLLTDAVIDNKGLPVRNRLCKGIKSDLSSVRERIGLKSMAEPAAIAEELSEGPVLGNKSTGLGLGFDPSSQPFGATTGRMATDVKGASSLLYILVWRGIIELPPIGVTERGRRKVGGQLFSDPSTLSWPAWSIDARLADLKYLFGIAEIHDLRPDLRTLRHHGILGVFRSVARPINDMLDVFPWGQRIA